MVIVKQSWLICASSQQPSVQFETTTERENSKFISECKRVGLGSSWHVFFKLSDHIKPCVHEMNAHLVIIVSVNKHWRQASGRGELTSLYRRSLAELRPNEQRGFTLLRAPPLQGRVRCRLIRGATKDPVAWLWPLIAENGCLEFDPCGGEGARACGWEVVTRYMVRLFHCGVAQTKSHQALGVSRLISE